VPCPFLCAIASSQFLVVSFQESRQLSAVGRQLKLKSF
jgi:hypothetical protein